MHIDIELVERITSEQLCKLPLGRNEPREDEDDIYTEDGINDLEDEDSISIGEGGFMRGYISGA